MFEVEGYQSRISMNETEQEKLWIILAKSHYWCADVSEQSRCRNFLSFTFEI
jgi:hypothetical protein